MIPTTFIKQENLLNFFQNSISNLETKLALAENRILTDELYILNSDMYQFITYFLKPENRIERLLFSHIFHLIYRCETHSYGSANLILRYSINLIKNFIKHDNFLLQKTNETNKLLDEAIEETTEQIFNKTQILTEDILNQEILGYCEDDEKLYNLVQNALELSGLEGTINVSDEYSKIYSAELRHGYSFKTVLPLKIILNQFKNKVWQRQNVKCIIIDGIVEKVSELDKILSKSFETKIPLIIVSHGFSEEIIATVHMNNMNKKFDIMLIRADSSLENLNLTNDISVISGSDIISSFKGDIITFKDYDSFPLIDFVKCTENELLLRNDRTIRNVGEQIKMLLEKRKEKSAIEDISKIYDKRISNLMIHSVEIKLPFLSEAENKVNKTKIDNILRMTKTLLNNGFIEKIKIENNSIFGKIISDSFNQISYKRMPALSAILCIKLATKSIYDLLSTSGGVIFE